MKMLSDKRKMKNWKKSGGNPKPKCDPSRFLAGIGRFLEMMEKEARRRGAAVFRAEEATRGNPFRILVFTMLSARTKDETTLKALGRVFRRAKSPKRISALSTRELEMLIHDVGFFHVKVRNLKALSRMVASEGGVPDNLEGLLALPGVGRKTANVVLAQAFGKQTIGVDTHMQRIANRLGLVHTKKPEETEMILIGTIPRKLRGKMNVAFVGYGQTVCLPRRPLCECCVISRICQRVGVDFR